MQIPTLTTDRLFLREPALADWPAFAEMVTSDRARFMGGPFTVAGAWGLFCHGIALWRLFGIGILSIEVRETGQYVGQIEINQGPRCPEPELGWQLNTGAEGKGYAFEAASAMRDWAFRDHDLKTLVSYIAPHNARSIRLAERLGATLDRDARVQDPGDLVYRHLPGTVAATSR